MAACVVGYGSVEVSSYVCYAKYFYNELGKFEDAGSEFSNFLAIFLIIFKKVRVFSFDSPCARSCKGNNRVIFAIRIYNFLHHGFSFFDITRIGKRLATANMIIGKFNFAAETL